MVLTWTGSILVRFRIVKDESDENFLSNELLTGAEDLGGNPNDREHFTLLVEELSEVFRIKNWLLSASVAASRFKIEDGYNVPHISYYLDMMNILAFDLHSEREEVADHHSPLYRRTHDQGLDVFYNAVRIGCGIRRR